MPTYDYRCKKCGYKFEEFQSMTVAQLTTCPQCGEETLERLIGGGAGLLFKGSGFYLTDYKKSSSSPATKDTSSSSTTSPGETSSSTKKSDS